jgi:gamma-tubulin complex component 2
VRTYSRYEYGSIAHAVSSTIKGMLKEFDLIVAQLEHLLSQQRLSLQRMVFLLQPTKITLRCLDHFIARLSSHVGGSMLDIIHAGLLEQGDEKSRQLYASLLQAATKPFVRMLSQWLYEGILQDPYEEFFIAELRSLMRHSLEDDFNAHYWKDRYQLRATKIPTVLQAEVQKVLITGKYLNVIRECCSEVKLLVSGDNHSTSPLERDGGGSGVLISFTLDDDLIVTLKKHELVYDTHAVPSAASAAATFSAAVRPQSTPSLIAAIEEAYQFSSSTFLQLLEKKYALRSHLKSLKRFFLLENGDFFIQFMDLTEDELRKDVKEISLARIQNLLLLSLHTSTLVNDPNKDELSCVFASHNLIQHLHQIQTAGEGMSSIGHPPPSSSATPMAPVHPLESFSILGGQGLKGIEALTLEYKVGWPLSIILSKRAITKYQLLSRLLFFCKYIELVLLECWKDNQRTKEMNLRRVMSSSYSLRHRMLHFIQNFVYYMTNEVMTPRYHEMLEGMSKAGNIDEVIGLHESFLDLCLNECLLASQDLLRILTKITTTCLLFAEQMKRFAFDRQLDEEAGGVDSRGGGGSRATSSAGESIKKKSQLRALKLRIQADYISREVSHDAYLRTLAKFSDTFDSQLGEFLEKLWTDSYRSLPSSSLSLHSFLSLADRTHPQLSNLCIRLDYNGFYDTRFAGQQNIRAEYGASAASSGGRREFG